MTRVQTWVQTTDWLLVADTEFPQGDQPRQLVAPVVASWAIDQLPPVAQPETVTFQIKDDGSTSMGDRWLPMEIGTPIAVYVTGYYPTNPLAGVSVVTFQGRITDVSAVNLDGGGLLFTLICTSRLADWNSTNAPNLTGEPDVSVAPSWLQYAYLELVEDAGLPLNTDDGGPVGVDAPSALINGRAVDNTGVSSGDFLGQLALQDLREDASGVEATHWIAYDADQGDPPPPVTPNDFRTVRYEPQVLDLAGILTMSYDAGLGLWTAILNPDYYADKGNDAGVLLYASQVLQDVGAWTTSRLSTINTVELQGQFSVGSYSVIDSESVRVDHPDLVTSSGRQSRSLQTPEANYSSAGGLARAILGPRSQVEAGFGLSQATVVWDTLTTDQINAWGAELWPLADVALLSGGPLGRPVAIAEIPTDWSLAEGPVVFGRLMGVTVTVDVAARTPGETVPGGGDWLPAAGRILIGMQLRALPSTTDAGITWDDMGNLPGTDPDWIDLDPALSWDDFSLIGF